MKRKYYYLPILLAFFTLSTSSSYAQGGVTVQATVDNEPPTINIIAPPNGTTISGNEDVKVTITHDGGVVKVEFFVDDILKLTDTSSPFEFILDTGTISNGSHTITAIVTDILGKTATDTITIIVNNSTLVKPPTSTPVTPTEEERRLLIFPGLESIRLVGAPYDFVTANSNFFYGFLFALELLILYWIIKKLRERKNKDK